MKKGVFTDFNSQCAVAVCQCARVRPNPFIFTLTEKRLVVNLHTEKISREMMPPFGHE